MPQRQGKQRNILGKSREHFTGANKHNAVRLLVLKSKTPIATTMDVREKNNINTFIVTGKEELSRCANSNLELF